MHSQGNRPDSAEAKSKRAQLPSFNANKGKVMKEDCNKLVTGVLQILELRQWRYKIQ